MRDDLTKQQATARLLREPSARPAGPTQEDKNRIAAAPTARPGGPQQATIAGRSDWQTRAAERLRKYGKLAKGSAKYTGTGSLYEKATPKGRRAIEANVERFFPYSDPNNLPTPQQVKQQKRARQNEWTRLYDKYGSP